MMSITLEDTMIEGKLKEQFIMEKQRVKDVFSEKVLENFVEAVFNDEKERLVSRDWASDNPEDRDTKQYLSLAEGLRDRLTDMWAHEYAFFAYETTMKNFKEEFIGYVDSVHEMESEYDEFIEKVQHAKMTISVSDM